MTAPDEWCSECPVCQGRKRDAEAEAGLRCLTCGVSFQASYRIESREHPGYCNGCGSVLNTRTGAGRYGTGMTQ